MAEIGQRSLSKDEALLASAVEFLRREVAPVANRLDRDRDALVVALGGLADRGLLALRRPEAFGGPALGESAFRSFQEEVARASGALAFLQTQHQSAVSLIAKGTNEALQARLLPQMHGRDRLIGVGFSQLRRPGPPLLRATETTGGFKISGEIPWITGYGIFPEFLIGAQLPDGRAVFGVTLFRDTETLFLSPPMELAAMESAQTVSGLATDLFLPDAFVVDAKPAGWILKNDLINITLQGFFAIGCARGSLDLLAERAVAKPDSAIPEAHRVLEGEIQACRTALARAQGENEDTTEEKLRLRAWAIDLAMRTAHAAIAAVGGSANSLDHPAQRLLREALVYTVSAQTPAIRDATLQRLMGQKAQIAAILS